MSTVEPVNPALFAARGVVMCSRCGTVARIAMTTPEAELPHCSTCGQPMSPYHSAENRVGTDPRNALWGFGGFGGI